MKNLLIIGARGWGREVFGMLPDCQGYGTEFVVKGFLDDKVDALENYEGYPPIIDSVEHYEPHKNDVFVCALGEPKWKKYYAEIMVSKGGKFINLIHKNAFIGKNTKLGKGCIISREASVSCDVVVGDFVTLQRLSTIGHDSRIGNYCHMGTYSFMGGYSIMEDLSMIYTRGTLIPHKRLGESAVLGVGSVAMTNVKTGTTVIGIPAKVLKI
jgi:sugar O-acyltransferase (sialic acid O-acetyltransferase NeuD family)